MLDQGRLIKPQWWVDSDCRVGDVVFRPAKMTAEQLQQSCLDARRSFFRSSSILRRMNDFRANLKSPVMAAIYLALNWQGRGDIELRQGLRLGEGLHHHEPL